MKTEISDTIDKEKIKTYFDKTDKFNSELKKIHADTPMGLCAQYLLDFYNKKNKLVSNSK